MYSGDLSAELWRLYLQEMPWAGPHEGGEGHFILDSRQNQFMTCDPMSWAGPTGSGGRSSSTHGQTYPNFGSSGFLGWILVAIGIFRLHAGQQTWMWGVCQKNQRFQFISCFALFCIGFNSELSTLQFIRSTPSSRSTSESFWLVIAVLLKVWRWSFRKLQPTELLAAFLSA